MFRFRRFFIFEVLEFNSNNKDNILIEQILL